MSELRDYQQNAVDAAKAFLKQSTDPCLIEAPTGCHGLGHPILMADGSIQPVEEVRVGDLIMGPDSLPRTVLRLHRGRQPMWCVTPVKGEPFVVNEGHVFSLYISPAKSGRGPGYTEATIPQMSDMGSDFNHRKKLQRVAIEMPYKHVPVPPWIVGAMIGDGSMTQGTPSFCTMDPEVVMEIGLWAMSMGCELVELGKENGLAKTYNIVYPKSTRSIPNPARQALEAVGIYWTRAAEKAVPKEYMTGSRQQRLDIIAGLLDTDGCVSHGGHDWITKSPQLGNDMVYLCRSVGLAAYLTECVKGCQNGFKGAYYRVSISGDFSDVPFRCPRRIPKKRKINKNPTVTGFSSRPVGDGDYYGFELDGDHLYLDGHFVRHHNSGKSHIVSALADWLHDISGGKRVLCLAPQKELVVQNAAKMRAIRPCSIFSASAGVKSTKHEIVFATPMTVSRSISRFTRGDYCAIVLDEAHTIAPTVLAIIDEMRAANPNLRVVGLTATPFKLGRGFIFRVWPNDKANDDDVCRDPFFTKLVYTIDARYLIEQGFLTPPVIGAINTGAYDTSGLTMRANGQFDAESVDAAFVGHGRKTSAIVADVVAQSQNREGVVFFAATIRHAEEVMASLPPHLSACITGKTDDRDKILKRFERKELKYLVNVGVLTTGWDCAHVDVIALLRRTESVGLLQQMIGRGLRLSPGKADCMVLDYAANLETHCPDGDLFKPIIKAKSAKGPGIPIEAECPECGYVNEFSLQPDYADFARDKHGYCLDVFGNQIMTEYGPQAAHYGRRCCGMVRTGSRGEYERCGHFWTSKMCEACDHPNDIAARFCSACKAELVDPNQRLVGEFVAAKKDPTRVQTDRVLSVETRTSMSQKGNETIRVDFVTPFRQFSIWLLTQPKNAKQAADLARWEATNGDPVTVSYVREAESQFWRVLAYGQPPDDEQLPDNLKHDSKVEKLRKFAA